MLDYGVGEDLYWDPLRKEVRFSVAQGERRLLCRIEADALGPRCAEAPGEGVCLDAARRHFGHITHRISDKLALGLTEADGSVLIRAKDW